MTTAELIAALQAADPSGGARVMCNGDPVTYCILKEPWYDGPTHSIEGDVYRIARTGPNKLVLYTEGIEEWLMGSPDGTVELVGMTADRERQERAEVERLREIAREENRS